MIDKNQAIIDYLVQCPQILNSPLYFNLIDAQDNNIQIITTSEDKTMNKPFIDGSVAKRYTFNLVVFKSISDLAIVKDVEQNAIQVVGSESTSTSTSPSEYYPNENVDDLAEAQALIDWIEEQNDLRNFPNFGDKCLIDDIMTTTDTPRFDGINTELSPPLATYSIAIVVNYIDQNKMITI